MSAATENWHVATRRAFMVIVSSKRRQQTNPVDIIGSRVTINPGCPETTMLNLLGSPRRLCDGVSRREFLRLGTLGAIGFGLADHLAHAAERPAAAARFGQA